jgi:thiamine kinase-like enzyme
MVKNGETLKASLIVVHMVCYGGRKRRLEHQRQLKQKTKLLETLQGTDGDSDRPKIMRIQKELHTLLEKKKKEKKKELKWKQMSKEAWLKEGGRKILSCLCEPRW